MQLRKLRRRLRIYDVCQLFYFLLYFIRINGLKNAVQPVDLVDIVYGAHLEKTTKLFIIKKSCIISLTSNHAKKGPFKA